MSEQSECNHDFQVVGEKYIKGVYVDVVKCVKCNADPQDAPNQYADSSNWSGSGTNQSHRNASEQQAEVIIAFLVLSGILWLCWYITMR